jgi:hypothetical protein
MATDQDEKTTDAASGIGYSDAQMNTLSAKFDAGDKIFAADIDEVIDHFVDFVSHTHDLVDIKQKDTFGNTAGNQTVTAAGTTGGAQVTALNITRPSQGASITASDITAIVNSINSLRTHVHSWDDVTTSGGSGTPLPGNSDPGSSCFREGSLVLMADGTSKAIEDIQVGDEVIGQTSTNSVIRLKHQELDQRDMAKINDDLLDMTVSHPVLTTDGWKSFDPQTSMDIHPEMGTIGEIQMGDQLVTREADGTDSTVEVTKITRYLTIIPVYNIDVSGDDTYIVNNVIVHNK